MKTLVMLLLFTRFVGAQSEKYDYQKIVNMYEYMSIENAKKHWPSNKKTKCNLLSADFSKLPVNEKSVCLINAAEARNLINKNRNEIISKFGDGDSYFFSEMNLSYELAQKNQDKNKWVVSFFISSDEKVRDIKIAKKCCYSKGKQ